MKRSALRAYTFWFFAIALGSATRLTPQNTQDTDAIPVPAQAPTTAPAPARTDLARHGTGIRVIAIDPGHGGTEMGAVNVVTQEKNWTLDMGRKLRANLQSRLGVTALLTRDSDVALTNEARAAVANNSQADLFISLHAGYSAAGTESGAAIYLMKDSAAPSTAGGRTPLFLPWYEGYRSSQSSSTQVAETIREQLSVALPESMPSVRYAPIAVLASLTMPAVVVEFGNLNDPVSAQAMTEPAFQTKLIEALVSAIEHFAAARQGAAAN